MTDIDSEKTIVGNFNYVTIVHKHESVSLHYLALNKQIKCTCSEMKVLTW